MMLKKLTLMAYSISILILPVKILAQDDFSDETTQK